MVEMEQNYKISARDKTVKGTCEYDSLKNPQKYFQNLGKKIWIKNVFRPQNFEKPLSLAIFEQKICRISEQAKKVKGTCQYDGSNPLPTFSLLPQPNQVRSNR